MPEIINEPKRCKVKFQSFPDTGIFTVCRTAEILEICNSYLATRKHIDITDKIDLLVKSNETTDYYIRITPNLNILGRIQEAFEDPDINYVVLRVAKKTDLNGRSSYRVERCIEVSSYESAKESEASLFTDFKKKKELDSFVEKDIDYSVPF